MDTVARHLAVMGTALAVTIGAPTRSRALNASEAAVRAVEAAESLLSTWRDDTPLARLNAARPGLAMPVAPELFALLRRVFEWEETTGGAFDPTVAPLVRAWGLRGTGRIPTPSQLAEARRSVGPSLFTFEDSPFSVSRGSALAGIDEGAWGKGWALDRAAEAARAAGATSVVLDLGGQVLASGTPTSVAVAHPRGRTRTVATLRLKDASASTSGNSERGLVVDGRRVGHLLDPRTGEPSPDFGSVTVVAADGLTADVLSTAFFVLGPERGLALSERLRAAGVVHEALFFSEGEEGGGLTFRGSPGMRALLENDAGAGKADAPADHEKLKELEQKLDVLTKEIESMRLGENPSAPPAATPSSTPTLGLGPSASRVYARSGVSVGGYGETIYQNFSTARQDGSPSNLTPVVDVARAVLYFGYKFDDHFVFNSELEFEHAVTASDKNGEAEIEFAYMDWLSGSKAFNLRAGLMLIPVGLINQLHEPPVFLGSLRPDVETIILPSTWREIGVGGWGDFGPFSWRLYLVNGLDASRYAADGLREGSQEGSLALARSFAVTGRLDYTGLPGILVGGSFFSGNSGQGQVTPSGESFAGRTTFLDFHLDARYRGAQFRAVWARSTVGDAAAINRMNNLEGDESVGSRQEGWYAEAGFDVFSLVPKSRMSLIPFVRVEAYDTQAAVPAGYARNPEFDARVVTVGANFKPIPQIVIKADGQWRRNAAYTGVKQFNMALGYEF